ncbi:MAG: TonB-dependent receptor, partial [Gluconacetobacter diazotrophicus]|nr:TonB-dependent receptor [Gluconacetobacter diazotrophicus]
ETPAGGDVVVTGFRSSLRNAIQTKRRSDQIVESISAEDIGKLPDNSIAESIARLPGITAQRLNGRDSVISIRGLAPDFTTTLLNGREQVSTGDNRSVEFDQYPSELISSVVVYKTPEAGLVGSGLAGTVDLRTIRPLDYHQRVLSFNARGEEQLLGSQNEDGYRVSGTYIDQFFDGKLGISVGVAHEESPNLQTRFNDYGFATVTGPTGQSLLVPGGVVSEAYDGSLNRTGVSVTIQYRPNSHFTSTLDGYYSDYNNLLTYHGLEQGLAYGGTSPAGVGPVLEPGYTNDGTFVTNGVYDNIFTVQRNDLNRRQANLLSIGYNADYNDGPWHLIGDVSYSGVRRRDRLGETYSGDGRNFAGVPDKVGFNLADDGQITLSETANHADPSRIFLTSPQGWGSDVVPGGQDGYLNEPLVRDELIAYRGSIARTIDEWGVHSIEVGGNFTHRFKSYTPDQYFLGLNADLADPTHTTSVPFPSNVLQDPADLSFVGLGPAISADPEALLSSGLYSFLRNPNADVATAAWKIKEDVSTGWFKANINQPLFGGTLTGNAGVQLVFTDQQGVGVLATGAPIIARSTVQDGVSYWEPLPSINLSYRMPDNGDVIRFAVARELARARLDQLTPSINYSYAPNLATSTSLSASPFGGGGGNIRLRPYISDAVDLSLEHYFGRDGYVSLAAYYKYLETYIFDSSQLFDFTGYPVPPGEAQPLLRQGFVTIPENGAGGNLYGLEATLVTPLTTLLGLGDRFGMHLEEPWLDGFGISGSASWTESTVLPGGPMNPAGPLPGQSKWVGNGTFYYEKYGFSARASVRYRSKFLGEVSGFGDARTFSESEDETIVDAQIGYTFDHGRLKGLGILLQGNNLTNEPFITYQNGDPRRILSDQTYGRRILFGVSYKY